METTKHIRREGQGAKLAPKYYGKYGAPVNYSRGGIQRIGKKCALFIIYMGGMMEDYASLIARSQIPQRTAQEGPALQEMTKFLQILHEEASKQEEAER